MIGAGAAAASLAGLAVGAALTSGTPVLAGPWAPGQQGYGHVRPARVSGGGDPTGLVTGIRWRTWGGATAVGTGTAEYVGPHQVVANGTEEPARIVLFHLGRCHGRRAYEAIEWYFPAHGQRFQRGTYIDACTGTYYQRGRPLG
jgi:hypothetical protein